jgi:hypothetical protein
LQAKATPSSSSFGVRHACAVEREVFTAILAAVNHERDLMDSPLTLREVLAHHPDGKQILTVSTMVERDRLLAQNAIHLVKSCGNAMTADVVGILSQGLSKTTAARTFGLSRTTIYKSDKTTSEAKLNPGARGPFLTMNKTPSQPNRISSEERVRTCLCDWWFVKIN